MNDSRGVLVAVFLFHGLDLAFISTAHSVCIPVLFPSSAPIFFPFFVQFFQADSLLAFLPVMRIYTCLRCLLLR